MNDQELRQSILSAVEKKYPEVGFDIGEIELESPKNTDFGDIASNIAFKLSSDLKKSPQEIALELEKEFPDAKAVAGFLNFHLGDYVYQQKLADILKKTKDYGNHYMGNKKKVMVEFISANPTGPLTLANGRGGYSGDVLSNLFKKVGYQVCREYYLNDGGNQVKTLGESILVAHGAKSEKEDLYRGQYIDEWATNNQKLIDDNTKDPLTLGQLAAKDILDKYIEPSLAKMGIYFDNFYSEKEMISRGEVEKSLEYFKEKGLTKEEDSALWFKTTEYNDDKDRVLVKTDGEKTYFANDCAYHWDKFALRNFDRVVNFWGADHHGYVSRLSSAVEAMGYKEKLDIVIMQLVRLTKDGEEFKMSKRKGTYITIDDLFELIGTKDASDVARYFFLSRSNDTHLDFDLDLARDKTEKNPVYYVKYAYARVCGIVGNAQVELKNPDLSLIKDPSEIDLIKKLAELPDLVEQVANDKKYPVHRFTYYVYEVATKFHKFYHDCRVISDDDELTKARLSLVLATKNVLEIVGSDIMGLTLPEKM